jgi:hypothetical protein
MVRIYYRGAAAAVLVFDMTSRKSFNKLKDWVRGMRHVRAGTWVDSLAHSVSLICAGTVPHLLCVACHTPAPGFGLPTSAPGLAHLCAGTPHCATAAATAAVVNHTTGVVLRFGRVSSAAALALLLRDAGLTAAQLAPGALAHRRQPQATRGAGV